MVAFFKKQRRTCPWMVSGIAVQPPEVSMYVPLVLGSCCFLILKATTGSGKYFLPLWRLWRLVMVTRSPTCIKLATNTTIVSQTLSSVPTGINTKGKGTSTLRQEQPHDSPHASGGLAVLVPPLRVSVHFRCNNIVNNMGSLIALHWFHLESCTTL